MAVRAVVVYKMPTLKAPAYQLAWLLAFVSISGVAALPAGALVACVAGNEHAAVEFVHAEQRCDTSETLPTGSGTLEAPLCIDTGIDGLAEAWVRVDRETVPTSALSVLLEAYPLPHVLADSSQSTVSLGWFRVSEPTADALRTVILRV